MFQKARDTSYLESTSVLQLLIRWWKPLTIVTLSAALASLIFSGPAFIRPKFRSTVIFFPAASNSISNAILETSVADKRDLLAFGAEEQAEQMLQILNSDEIRQTIIEKYDLIHHYDIDLSKAFPQTRLIEEFRDNISFSRTEYMSVRIDVLDHDPVIAASIANDIASLLDTMKTKIQRSRANSALNIAKLAYLDKENEIQAKEDSLSSIRKKGVMDFRNQSTIWSEEYARAFANFNNEKASLSVLEMHLPGNDTAVINTKARIEGASARMNTLQEQLNRLAEYGGASVSLNEELTLARKELAQLKEQYKRSEIDATQNISHTFIVNHAVAAEKKSYPTRWLIILIATSAAFILALSVILLKEKIKETEYKF